MIERSLAYFDAYGDQRRTVALMDSLGRIASALGKPEESLQYFAKCLKIAREIGDVDAGIRFVDGISETIMNEGSYEVAVEVFAFLIHHPQSHQLIKDKAKQLLETDLKPHLPAEDFVAAQERGRARKLEEILDMFAYVDSR